MNKNIKFHFINLIELFTINNSFKIGELDGIVYCLLNSQKNEYYESAYDRIQT